MLKRLPIIVAAALLLAGCGPKSGKITATQRQEAAALVSEAQFALSVRDPARAESLLAKAAALCPDTGDYWLNLGRVRVRAGNRAGAKSAYQSAIEAYAYDAAANPRMYSTAVLRQIYALALLGRLDDARALLAKARKHRPEDRDLRTFAETRELESLVTTAAFKEAAI
jgi:tetratricopeptide (TPR) repeat protein